MKYFAASAANQNDLVAAEAQSIGAEEIHEIGGGIEFEGDLKVGYRFCMNSRIASRLMVGFAYDEDILSPDELYEASLALPWEDLISPDKTFQVTITTVRCSWLKNSQFGALRLKDAIVDRIREHFEDQRPSVDTENPDLTFHLHINGDLVKWYVDFSGKSMHKRRYREESTLAVMKENLAAAVIMRSPWYRSLQEGNPTSLLDPFCGSGTILIEAAMMAADIAPGLMHYQEFAFFNLPFHDEELFDEVLEETYSVMEANQRTEKLFTGWDIDKSAIHAARKNAKSARVDHLITFEEKDFSTVTRQDIPTGQHHIITDPPYGMRMVNNEPIEHLYRMIGRTCNTLFPGWNIAILCGRKELLSYVDMKPNRTNSLFNGPIESQLAHYYVFNEEEKQEFIRRAEERKAKRLNEPLSEGAQMVYNRLKKNLARLEPILAEQKVSSYRLYDADMPEYSAAIDIYEGTHVHLQEYAPPASIPEEDAQRRLDELIQATERATGIDIERIHVKQRKAQKGKEQYEKLDDEKNFFIMREHEHMFFVNFTDYLDTGIFLDHRPVRAMIEEQADRKRFLNLFCYTGTATVHAASGGAVSTVSVDASSTYLDWAIRNMELNGHKGMEHFYYKDDVISWLKDTHDMYDLIFCDPPTFSNSKMRREFDVYRDQKILIHQCMNHLSREGTLIFSTNFRKFRMEEELMTSYDVRDISEETIGEDFKRNQKIHFCWEITHKKVRPVQKESKPAKKKAVRKA